MKRVLVILIVFGFPLFFLKETIAYSLEKYPDKVENRFVVTPTEFDLELELGQEITKQLTIINRLGRKEEFFVEVERILVGENGEQMSLDDPVSWIKPELSSFFLDQGERINLDFKIKVPNNLNYVGYYANILISNKGPKEDERGKQVKLVSRIGVPFLAVVPGDKREQGSISYILRDKFFYLTGPVKFKTVFLNQGNVHLPVQGEARVYNVLNKQISNIKLDKKVVLPGKEVGWEFVFGKKWLIGKYRVLINLDYSDNKSEEIQKEITFWAFPIHTLFGVLAIIHIIQYLIKKFKERFKLVRK